MAKAELSTEKKQTVPKITLDEFCIRLSTTDNRVELIGGFHADEKRNKKVKDSEENFKIRFIEFIKRPA